MALRKEYQCESHLAQRSFTYIGNEFFKGLLSRFLVERINTNIDAHISIACLFKIQTIPSPKMTAKQVCEFCKRDIQITRPFVSAERIQFRQIIPT